ncbi:hypothetical protein, partial [Burkholderia pseudomallei]|uniref:hypothetical protein n=1 Tax=Burkholderia pseudomallei TaxID=28450 RepID=UPI001940345C
MFWESFHKVTFSVSQLSILPVRRQTVQKARGSRSPACSPPGFLAASTCAAPRYYLHAPIIGALASQARHDSRPQS